MKKKVVTLLTTVALSLSMLFSTGIPVKAASTVTFNGTPIDVSSATELTNDYATGYLLEDGSTLVLTAYRSGTDAHNLPFYSHKDSITKAIVADSVTAITGNCFNYYTNLTNVDFNNNMTEIGRFAFNGCTGLTSLDLPSSLITLGGFGDCTGLTSVTLNEGLTTIDDNVFSNCSNLTSINIPNTVTEIGRSAFSRTGLTSVVIPDSVTSIGSEAFYCCNNLTSIQLSNSITSLNSSREFFGCDNLTEITGGNSLTTVNGNAFYSTAVRSITVKTASTALLEHLNTQTNTTLTVYELDIDKTLGTKTLAVTGSVDNRVLTLDVSIPVGGISFAIDGDGNLTSQGIVIKSNTVVPLGVKVLSVSREDSGITSNTVATTLKAPELIPADRYTLEEWNNLGEYTTKNYMALAIKQVDVVGDIASASLTEATTDKNKVTTPVQLGNISANDKLAHILSASESEQSVGINIETDSAYTRYGKEWFNSGDMIFRYNINLEFSY